MKTLTKYAYILAFKAIKFIWEFSELALWSIVGAFMMFNAYRSLNEGGQNKTIIAIIFAIMGIVSFVLVNVEISKRKQGNQNKAELSTENWLNEQKQQIHE